MRIRKQFNTKGQSGQAIVIIAIAMAGLLAATVLAIDGSRYYSSRRSAQNAADESALAGVYYYARHLTMNSKRILLEIHRVAELNQIADPDGVPSDATNTNVSAFWVDANGNVISKVTNSSTAFAPDNAIAIRVKVQIPYTTFIGHFVGQDTLVAEASATARINNLATSYVDGGKKSVWVGGGTECNDTTEGDGGRIAHDYFNTNSAKFLADMIVNGSLVVTNDVTSADLQGDVVVNGVYSRGPGDPFKNASNSNKFAAGKGFSNPTTTPTDSWPPFYIIDGQRFDASYFDPTKSWPQYLASQSPALYHSWKASDYANNDALLAAIQATSTAMDAAGYPNGDKGVFYIDGDLTITAGTVNWGKVTIVTSGRFFSTGTGHDYWYSKYGFNLSILAGLDVSKLPGKNTSARCASYAGNWVFQIEGNNTQMHGIVYVPWGQFYVSGNTSGGSEFSGGIVAYSVRLGNTSPNSANSWQFNFNSALYNRIAPSTELMNN